MKTSERLSWGCDYARECGMDADQAQQFGEWFATHWPDDNEYAAWHAYMGARGYR